MHVVGFRYYKSVCRLALDWRLFQVNPPFKKLWRFFEEPTNPRLPLLCPIGRSQPIGSCSDLAVANRNSPLYSVFSWAEGRRHAHLGRARDAVVLYFNLLIHTEYLRIEEPVFPLVSFVKKKNNNNTHIYIYIWHGFVCLVSNYHGVFRRFPLLGGCLVFK